MDSDSNLKRKVVDFFDLEDGFFPSSPTPTQTPQPPSSPPPQKKARSPTTKGCQFGFFLLKNQLFLHIFWSKNLLTKKPFKTARNEEKTGSF